MAGQIVAVHELLAFDFLPGDQVALTAKAQDIVNDNALAMGAGGMNLIAEGADSRPSSWWSLTL